TSRTSGAVISPFRRWVRSVAMLCSPRNESNGCLACGGALLPDRVLRGTRSAAANRRSAAGPQALGQDVCADCFQKSLQRHGTEVLAPAGADSHLPGLLFLLSHDEEVRNFL